MAIRQRQIDFDLALDIAKIERLADYYELVQEHNAHLHLVGPCSPEEFAVRHILESLTLLEHLPQDAKFADVGAGAGLPSIPCLLVRDDLTALVIESKEKKLKFLAEALKRLGIGNRARVMQSQFREVELGECNIVTCRALDKFTENLPSMIKWADGRRLLLFGGHNMQIALEKAGIRYTPHLLPLSERRYLFVERGDNSEPDPRSYCEAWSRL